MMGDGAVKIHVMRLSCRGERVGQPERDVVCSGVGWCVAADGEIGK